MSAQKSYYPYYTADTTENVKLANLCSQKVESSFIVPEKVSKDYKKDFNAIKKESVDYTKALIKYTNTTDELINPFIQSVYKRIVDGNPTLSGYTIALSCYPMMNAANMGGKVVVFYIPLLSRLENESEVAAILCHELAHGELDHIQKGIRKTLDDYYNKDFQKELKATMKDEFNINAKMNLLSLKFTFGSRYHSRGLEKSADSLGYIFLSKTSFDASQSVSALEVLKHVDEPVYRDKFDYEKYFKCSTSKFDFNSIKPYKKTSIFTEVEKSNLDTLADSLRTHPDCEKRMGYIRDLMIKNPPKPYSKSDPSTYNTIQWSSAMEMIQAYFDYSYYDYALFNALSYFSKKPNDEYLKTIIALSLSGLYEAMKKHELSDYISNYSEESPVEFNDFLFMINNLRISELSSLTNCFYQTNISTLNENEFSIAAGYFNSKMNDDGKVKIWQDKYKSSYKEGRFTYLLDLNTKTESAKKKH
jgi:hypothetical protein